jgi:hypothetical protein
LEFDEDEAFVVVSCPETEDEEFCNGLKLVFTELEKPVFDPNRIENPYKEQLMDLLFEYGFNAHGPAPIPRALASPHYTNEFDDGVIDLYADNLHTILYDNHPERYLNLRPATLQLVITKAQATNPFFIPEKQRKHRTGLLTRFVNFIIKKLQSSSEYSQVISGINLTDLSLDQIVPIF